MYRLPYGAAPAAAPLHAAGGCLSIDKQLQADAVTLTPLCAQESALLEWVEDTCLLLRKGPASCIASHMAQPLLQHLHTQLAAACERAADDLPGPSLGLAFAHAETLIPVAGMLGLFGSPGPCSLDAGTLPLYHNVRPACWLLLSACSEPSAASASRRLLCGNMQH